MMGGRVIRLGSGEDELIMEAQQYRISWSVPTLGYLSIAVVSYAALLSAGVIDLKLTSKVDAFDLQDKGLLLFLALWFAGGVFLVMFGRTRVEITDEGIHYRGVVRSIYIRWSEVTRLHPAGQQYSVYLRSESKVIEIIAWFRNEKQLSDAIFERVRTNAPNAYVDQTYGFFANLKNREKSR